MSEFRWIKTSLLLILGLQFTATLGQHTFLIVRDGDEVTLPRGPHDTTKDQDKCDSTTWSFRSRYSEGDLVFHGKINENTKADRLSVTANCSLVIKKVTAEDAGRYICQHKSGTNQVDLSVVTMTEHQDADEVTLTCSVSPYGECEHTVEWLNEDEDNLEMMTQSNCSASVTTSLSESKSYKFFKCEVTDNFSGNAKQFNYLDSDKETVTVQTRTPFSVAVGVSLGLPCKSLTDDRCNSLVWLFGHSGSTTTTLFEEGEIKAKSDKLYVTSDCTLNIKKVTRGDAGTYTCRQFRSGQQHGEDTAYELYVVDSKDTKPATFKPTIKPTTTSKATTQRTSISTNTMKSTTTKANSKNTGTTSSASATNNPPTKQVSLWRVIIVSVGLAALIISVVAVNMWTRTKEKKTQMDEIAVRYDEDDGTVNYENIRPSDGV